MKMRDPGLARSKRTASDGCAIAGNKKCNPLTWDEFGGYRDGCCTTDQRCGEMEGDCSDDSDCLPGLVCGSNNCPNNTGFAERADCCELYSHVFTPGKIMYFDVTCAFNLSVKTYVDLFCSF